MARNSLKFSFIPKNSFGQEESFIERKRPQNIIEFIVSVSFILSIGAYGALYFWNSTITKQVNDQKNEVASIEFYDQAEIDKAVLFRTRTELVQTLLDAHLAVSPIFSFLTQNSLNSIYYDQFSFRTEGNRWVLDLTGEAPSYSSLAFQTDVLRKNMNEKNNKELSSFELSNITLTKFGTITFDMRATFAPKYLSYVKTFFTPPESSDVLNDVTSALSATSTPTSTGANENENTINSTPN